MSDELGAPSNGAGESVQAVESQVHTHEPENTASEKPAASAREALERAMVKVQGKVQGNEPAPDTTRHQRDENGRDESGKFTKASDRANDRASAQDKDQDLSGKDSKESANGEPQLKAPTRFTKMAQDSWGQTPEPVRIEVERAIGELTQGIEKYKSSAEAFEPVRKYHDMAAASGTTLESALGSYVNMENAWRENPVHGFIEVSRNLGIDPIAHLQHIAQALQSGNVQMPRGDSPEVGALKQQISALERQLGEFGQSFSESQHQARQRDAHGFVDTFAKDHPHFEDVADNIAQMLETGFAKDLSDAYAKAIRLNPDVALKIETEKAAQVAKPDPAHTREKASKSITGSPTSGSNLDSRKPAGSAREALTTAFAQVGIG